MPNVDDSPVPIDRYVPVGIRLPRLDRQRLPGLAGACLGAAAALTVLLFFLNSGAADRTGVRRQVFPDVGFNRTPLIDDVGTSINLDFLNDDPDLPRRFFSARWTGYWYVPEAAEVELHGAGDDRLDVWLDGALVIRRTSPADMHTLVRTLRLDAGVHELRVEYEQHGGAFNMRLNWALPGGRPRPLPAYRLFHERPDNDDVRLAYGVAWLQRLVATLWIAVIGISLAWLATLAWSRVGPYSTYGPYWASACRVSGTAFRVAIAGPLGLPASRGTGPSPEDSDSANRGTGGHFLADSKGPRTRMTIAVLLGLLFVGHVGVFGWRSVTFDRRVTGDSMNYIDVARNLSAGEGLVQSAAGFNQPTFWVRDFTPHFPEKTRAGHNPGYSVLIAAVAAVTGLEHADAAFVIGPAAYAAALASAFLFASRLLGPAAGLLAAAFVAHQIRWVFLRTWTEPVVVALLLALLALLARGTTPRRAVVGELLAGLTLLVRSGFVPVLALGGLAFRTQAPNEKCAGNGGHCHDRRQHAVVEPIGQHDHPSRHQEGRPAGYPRDRQNTPVSRPVRNNRPAVPDSPPPRARAEERRRGESPPGTFEKLGRKFTQRDVRKPAGGDRRLRRIDLSLTEERTRHCDAGPRGKQQQPAHPGSTPSFSPAVAVTTTCT